MKKVTSILGIALIKKTWMFQSEVGSFPDRTHEDNSRFIIYSFLSDIVVKMLIKRMKDRKVYLYYYKINKVKYNFKDMKYNG